MPSTINKLDRKDVRVNRARPDFEISFATSQQYVYFGVFYVVLASVTWGALHLLQLADVPDLAFCAMILAGCSFLLHPIIGSERRVLQVGLWGTWLSVLLLGQHPDFGSVLVVSGFIIVTLMLMIFAQGRGWIWMTILSLCAIAFLNLTKLSGANASLNRPEIIALMLAQLAQFLGAAVLFGFIFARFRAMFVNTVASNHQLSKQRAQLQEHSAELATLNNKLNDEINRTTLAQQEREQFALALQSKTDLLEIITQNLPAWVVYVDADDAVQFLNPEFAQKYDIAHLTPPIPIKSIGSKELIEALAASVENAMDCGETVTTEHTEQDRDGQSRIIRKSVVPHVVKSKVVGRLMLSIDVTELRSTQKSLVQTNRILKQVNNNLPARITYMDVNGTMLYSNRYPELVGKQRCGLLGCSKHAQLPDASASALVYHEERAFAGKSGDFEVRRLLHSGEEIIETVRYVPQNENGQLIGIFMLSMDVTESRHFEEMFQQAQKIESLGMLAGGVAHDFNNLLAGILGQSSVALARMDDDHPSRKHVQRAVNAAERASILTKQMLAYSGKGAFSIVLLNINILIQQNVELLAITLPRNVELDLVLADDLPLIEADEAQVQQVIMNLIINAGQAIGERKGHISVTTSVEVISAEIDAFWKITGKPLYAGTYVSIRIKDNGDGISPDLVTRIFDPFYTTKDDGTGLGLAAVLGVIRGHNGGIRLTTEVGQGTEFHLLFPMAEQFNTMTLPLEPPNPRRIASNDASLILVIDDEADVLEVVTDMLELFGIATITALSGIEGLALFRQHQEQISLVILDLMMPGMNGDETFSALRQIDPTVRIILSSGYSKAEASRRFVGNNVADFIQKPYAIDQMMDKVHGVLDPA